MLEKLNEKMKNLTVVDIGLTKLSVLFATIIIVKIFPQLLNISYTLLIVLVLILAAKPLYVVWIKK